MAALKVTDWFTDVGFNVEVNATDVVPEPTDWGYVFETLPVKFESPVA
jgi:hypothetical protein